MSKRDEIRINKILLWYNVSRERIRQIEKKILGNEVDKDGNLKAPHKDTVAFKKKVKEYCGFEFSDFS